MILASQAQINQTLDIGGLIRDEITTINGMLRAHNIRAATATPRVLVAQSSFVSYGLDLQPEERIANVEKIHRELAAALQSGRARRGLGGRVSVRICDQPVAIETPHPAPVALDWKSATMKQAPFGAVIGKRYYGGVAQETISLEHNHHMMVAAQSGGGKSTLMRMALSSLCYNTSPNDLAVLLIDLKNEDLVPFRKLPHCVGYAGNVEAAAAQIRRLYQLRDERIEGSARTPRVLLVIDELAELGEDKETLMLLARILSTGRSLGINVWGGTQYPTASTIGSVVSRSWTLRCVGRVDGAQAANIATQRPETGAQFLAHPGDFIRVDGPELVRFKAYWMPADVAGVMVDGIRQRWGSLSAPRLFDSETVTVASEPAPSAAKGETQRIAEIIQPLWEGGATHAEMIRAVFGRSANTGGSNRNRVLAAIELLDATTTTGSGDGHEALQEEE